MKIQIRITLVQHRPRFSFMTIIICNKKTKWIFHFVKKRNQPFSFAVLSCSFFTHTHGRKLIKESNQFGTKSTSKMKEKKLSFTRFCLSERSDYLVNIHKKAFSCAFLTAIPVQSSLLVFLLLNSDDVQMKTNDSLSRSFSPSDTNNETLSTLNSTFTTQKIQRRRTK